MVTERQPTGLWYFPDRESEPRTSKLCFQYDDWRFFWFRDGNINFGKATALITIPEHVLLTNLELIHWGSDDATST